jgi:rsbT co-antagonist protein RsbR
MATRSSAVPSDSTTTSDRSSEGLLPELVEHLRQNRTGLREEWARRITDARLLTAMTPEEIFSEATSVYDNYVEVLETGSVEALQDYARNLSERIIPRGVETDEVLGIVLLLRDVLARSLFEKYQTDFDLLNRVLDAYEPAANRIANTVGVSFVEERERIIRQQQEAIRELSTPVLQVRERLLILPIIGVLDGQRARQLTEQLLRAIRANRAKVVVIDITGVPAIDSTVANHLVQTVEASGLMGANVIITGLSSEIALTLVTIGVDLSKMNAVGDLQGGIEEAERLLGYKVTRSGELALDIRSSAFDARSYPQAGHLPDRDDPVGPERQRRAATSGRSHGTGRQVPIEGHHRRRHGLGCDGFVRGPIVTDARSYDQPARGRHGDRRNPTRGRLRDGAAGHHLRRHSDLARPRGRTRLLEPSRP